MGVCTCVQSVTRSPLTNIAMSKIDTGNDFNVPKMESSVSHKTSFENILLNEINIVRSSPYEYSNKLQKPCERIKKENNTYFFVYSEQEKIILQKGVTTFNNTIALLRTIHPMCKLQWNNELKVNMSNVDKKVSSIGNLIMEKKTELFAKYQNIIFNLDIFSEPVLSVIFQVTDEAFNLQRRNAILNPKFKMFAVGYTYDYNNKFISISTLA